MYFLVASLLSLSVLGTLLLPLFYKNPSELIEEEPFLSAKQKAHLEDYIQKEKSYKSGLLSEKSWQEEQKKIKTQYLSL